MTNPDIQHKTSFFSQIITWLKKILSSDARVVIDWQEVARAELTKEIRELIIKKYEEKLYLSIYSEQQLKFRPIEDLRAMLADLKNPKLKEPA